MKKILTINTVYSGGGASKVARQVFEGIANDENFDAYFAYGRGEENEDKKIYKFGFTFEHYLHGFLVRFLGVEGLGTYFSTKKLIKFIKKEKFDLVHIHNLHGYYLNFFKLVKFLSKSKIPVVWTLHDEWALTWMPAHSMGCSHCKTLEGECTSSGYGYPKTYNKVFSKYMLKKKQKVFSKWWNITIACPSEWLKKEVEKSYLHNCAIKLVRNGVDVNVFKPLSSKEELKNKYNIPLNKKIVLFAIADINDINKGYSYIKKTIKNITDDDTYFVGVGNPNIEISNRVKTVGYVSDDKSMSEIYNLADVFLYTSLIETMSLTILEAMSCGLPIVSFDILGVQELLNKNFGKLVKVRDSQGLIDEVKLLLDSDEVRNNMSILVRDRVIYRFSLDMMLSQYNVVYKNILKI